jgi:ribonuclease P protein component
MQGKFKKAGINKKERIKKKAHFLSIFKNGERIDKKKLKIFFTKNDRNISRFAVVTSKRLGSSVQRNRIKRIIKEVFRRNKEYFGKNMDWIFIPQGKWKKISYHDTERFLLDVIKGIEKKKRIIEK